MKCSICGGSSFATVGDSRRRWALCREDFHRVDLGEDDAREILPLKPSITLEAERKADR